MDNTQNILQKFAIKVSDWSEKWFPDSYIFALLGVIIVAIAAIGIGASVQDVAISFGNGFWSLIPFTMQMCMLIVVGYVVSVSKPVEMLIQKNGSDSHIWKECYCFCSDRQSLDFTD